MKGKPGAKPDTSYIPPDSPYWNEAERGQDHWIRADRLTADPMPVKFQKWLEFEGFDNVPMRENRKYVIGRRLKRLGVAQMANDWRKAAVQAMTKLNLKDLSPPVAREIAWRLVEMKKYDYQPSADKERAKVTKQPETAEDVEQLEEVEGMKFLPSWCRWVVMHPSLLVDDDALATDPLLQKASDDYQKAFPCPHQAALNQFTLYRGDRKLIDGLFKDIMRLHMAGAKKADTPDPDADTESSVESKSIASLESILSGFRDG